MEFEMKDDEYQATRLLRARGYAVCVFNPQELEGVKPSYVEDAMCETGWTAIESLKD